MTETIAPTGSRVDNSALALMAEELDQLRRIFAAQGLNGCRDLVDIFNVDPLRFFIGVQTPVPTDGAHDALLTFKPTPLYVERVSAAWALAGKLDLGLVRPDKFVRLSAHGEETGAADG